MYFYMLRALDNIIVIHRDCILYDVFLRNKKFHCIAYSIVINFKNIKHELYKSCDFIKYTDKYSFSEFFYFYLSNIRVIVQYVHVLQHNSLHYVINLSICSLGFLFLVIAM